MMIMIQKACNSSFNLNETKSNNTKNDKNIEK